MASMPHEPKAGVSGWVSLASNPNEFIRDSNKGLSSDQSFRPGGARSGVSRGMLGEARSGASGKAKMCVK